MSVLTEVQDLEAVIEYVQKPLRWHEKALIWIGILSLMAGIFACARWVSRHRLL